ncbi:hypothetical protein OKW38_001571 [Paraburkholderia sp. MM5496-R1]|uniref:J domain-containing protein n=1 Tax=Paraburkholderia sp. MM5496-R1 TaxID=2991065 RepID=UPI003D1A994F
MRLTLARRIRPYGKIAQKSINITGKYVGEKIHSHYDNLKVSRDAPPEVIRAAYKTLTQKYHPDRRPDDPSAARVMKIINGSYEVLSDPVKRKDHDEWLARKEREAAADAAPKTPPPHTQPESCASPRPTIRPQPIPRARAAKPKQSSPVGRTIRAAGPLFWIPMVFLGFGGIKMLIPRDSPDPPKPYAQPAQYVPNQDGASLPPAAKASNESGQNAGTPSVARSVVQPWNMDASALRAAAATPPAQPTRPLLAPNGTAWPIFASYLSGARIGRNSGHSQVMIDNARNNFGVFAKLTSIDGATHVAVRQFYIPARASFTLSNITPGNYDIRYENVTTGSLFKSEMFNLSEHETVSGIEYADVSITLYSVPGGNMLPVPITEAEF